MPTHDNTPPDDSPWKVGDLALCVKGGKRNQVRLTPRDYPRAGQIGRVLAIDTLEGVTDDGLKDITFLEVEGFPINGPIHNRPIWPMARFVRIPPKAKDEEDEETIRLYNSKQKVTS